MNDDTKKRREPFPSRLVRLHLSAVAHRLMPVFGGFPMRARMYRYATFALVLGTLLAAAFADMSLPM